MKIIYIAHPISGDIKGNLEAIRRIVRDINIKRDDVVPFAPYWLDCHALDDTNLDAINFLSAFGSSSVDLVLYDPPYSQRQLAEQYKKMGHSVNMQTTQSSYWGRQKKEVTRIVKPNGIVITCAWNSGGMGINNGFEIIQILLVAHGGWHNDTIVTVERKTATI